MFFENLLPAMHSSKCFTLFCEVPLIVKYPHFTDGKTELQGIK